MNELIRIESGQSMVEYALIIATVVLAVLGSLAALGTNINELFERFLEKAQCT